MANARATHALWGTFLSDRDLGVTDLFGLRNMTIALQPQRLPGLTIPTTLLADATGKVVWKDQSSDDMQRSDPVSVREGLAKLD